MAAQQQEPFHTKPPPNAGTVVLRPNPSQRHGLIYGEHEWGTDPRRPPTGAIAAALVVGPMCRYINGNHNYVAAQQQEPYDTAPPPDANGLLFLTPNPSRRHGLTDGDDGWRTDPRRPPTGAIATVCFVGPIAKLGVQVYQPLMSLKAIILSPRAVVLTLRNNARTHAKPRNLSCCRPGLRFTAVDAINKYGCHRYLLHTLTV